MVYLDPCFSDCECDGYADHGLGAVPDGYIQYFIRLGSMNRWMNKVLDKRRGSPIGDHWEMLSLQDSNIPKPGKELEEYLKDAHRRRVELKWRSHLHCGGGLVCGVVNRHTIPAKNVHPDCTCDLEKMIEAGGCKTKMNFLTPAASQQDCYHCDTMKRNEWRARISPWGFTENDLWMLFERLMQK